MVRTLKGGFRIDFLIGSGSVVTGVKLKEVFECCFKCFLHWKNVVSFTREDRNYEDHFRFWFLDDDNEFRSRCHGE